MTKTTIVTGNLRQHREFYEWCRANLPQLLSSFVRRNVLSPSAIADVAHLSAADCELIMSNNGPQFVINQMEV